MDNEKLFENRLVKILSDLKLSDKTIEKAKKINDRYKILEYDIDNKECNITPKDNSKTKKKNTSKRSLSAYQLFSKDIRNEVTKEIKNDENNKELNGREINNKIMKEIGVRWSNISDDEKIIYEEKAQKLKTK